jgi:hypothetical protein
MLVGDVGVEAEAGVRTVAGVDLAGGIAPPGRAEELPVRDELVPSPQIAAIGSAWCASMMRASAAW